MVKITVPVTRGGNRGRIHLTSTPKTMATMPPTISAHSMVGRPNSPPMAWSVGM